MNNTNNNTSISETSELFEMATVTVEMEMEPAQPKPNTNEEALSNPTESSQVPTGPMDPPGLTTPDQ